MVAVGVNVDCGVVVYVGSGVEVLVGKGIAVTKVTVWPTPGCAISGEVLQANRVNRRISRKTKIGVGSFCGI